MSDESLKFAPPEGTPPSKDALTEGLRIVKQATVEDQKGNFDEAVQLYAYALQQFQIATDEETHNQKVKDLISEKSVKYTQRMEHLRVIILQNQFPDVPETKETEEVDIAELEKQFADPPVSDNSYYASQQGIEAKVPPPEYPDEAPSYACPSPSPSRLEDADLELQEGPQDPQVLDAIDKAAGWITQAKEAESKGDLLKSVKLYRKGLKYLYSAYNRTYLFLILIWNTWKLFSDLW